MADSEQEVWLVRHAETEWSKSGRHTGRTNVPLTDAGRERARQRADRLHGHDFALVLSSPLERARETARFADALTRCRSDSRSRSRSSRYRRASISSPNSSSHSE